MSKATQGRLMKQETPAPVGRPREFDRDAALRTAMKLFGKYGYEGVSISELTRAIGIVPTSLYAAFGSKEMLYREALALCLQSLNLPNLISDNPVRAWVLTLLRDTVRDATDPDYPGCMVTIGMVNCGAEHGALVSMVAAMRNEYIEKISVNLIRAAPRSELPVCADEQTLGRYILALMQGIALQARDGATSEELLNVVDFALQSWPNNGGQAEFET